MIEPTDEEQNNLDCIKDYELHSSNKKFIEIICNKLQRKPTEHGNLLSRVRLPGKIWLHGIRSIIDIEYDSMPNTMDTTYLNIINPFNYSTIRSLHVSNQSLEQMVTNLIEQLNKLVYHKVYGFMDLDSINLNDSLMGLFKNTCSAIKFGTDTCCVCYDECNSKTPCGHDVCMQCLSAIPLYVYDGESDNEDESEGISCPMCRVFIPILPFDFEPNNK